MKVSILLVERSKPILELGAFDHVPVRQHLERKPAHGSVQDSQIQDWPKTTTFLGYDETRAVKPLTHLGWRDWLNCILCQEDNNFLSQDRSVPGCHQSLKNVTELGRSLGELNRVLNHESPTRQAGQCEPCLQMPCKWLQRHNWHIRGGAAKGSRAGWYRRRWPRWRFSTGRSSSGGHRRAPTVTSRLGLAHAAHTGARCSSVCFSTAENYCSVLDSVAEQSSLEDESVEKVLCRLRPLN